MLSSPFPSDVDIHSMDEQRATQAPARVTSVDTISFFPGISLKCLKQENKLEVMQH
jgi:hypothetical protein